MTIERHWADKRAAAAALTAAYDKRKASACLPIWSTCFCLLILMPHSLIYSVWHLYVSLELVPDFASLIFLVLVRGARSMAQQVASAFGKASQATAPLVLSSCLCCSAGLPLWRPVHSCMCMCVHARACVFVFGMCIRIGAAV